MSQTIIEGPKAGNQCRNLCVGTCRQDWITVFLAEWVGYHWNSALLSRSAMCFSSDFCHVTRQHMVLTRCGCLILDLTTRTMNQNKYFFINLQSQIFHYSNRKQTFLKNTWHDVAYTIRKLVDLSFTYRLNTYEYPVGTMLGIRTLNNHR